MAYTHWPLDARSTMTAYAEFLRVLQGNITDYGKVIHDFTCPGIGLTEFSTPLELTNMRPSWKSRQ